MEINSLFLGESKNIEYKREIPKNSTQYMKTVVAFANVHGGRIVFGVEDGKNKVVGVQETEIFHTIDAITNAISDSCEPRINPDITLQTIEDKTVIIVEIEAGKQRPYYLKSRGIVAGTYIRVAGTTRVAEEFMLKELILEGQNRYYDSEICEYLTVNAADINRFCEKIKMVAIHNSMDESAKKQIKDVTKNVLLSWGVLVEKNGKVFPSNAYALLAGKSAVQPIIQCAIFKGNDRSFFVDRREFTGTLYEQMEAAYQYVLEKINLGAKIDGLYRQDVYELPINAVRELIANAIAHRSYIDPGNIQIALYDNRLEVISPGMLLNGVSIEKMKEGYSKIRNRAITNVFSYMKIIEKWGSDIPRIIRECKEYGLPELELIDFDGDFRVNMYRVHDGFGTSGTNLGTNGTNDINSDEIKIDKLLLVLKNNPKIKQKELPEKLGMSLRTIKRLMADLQKNGKISKKGNTRSVEWIVL